MKASSGSGECPSVTTDWWEDISGIVPNRRAPGKERRYARAPCNFFAWAIHQNSHLTPHSDPFPMILRPLPLLLASILPTLAADPVQLPAKKDFHLFILAGQSNMAGRGKLDDEARQPKPRVLSLNKEGQWQPAVDPLHWDKSAAGTGIGRPFADVIAAKDPSITVGLIPTACGGSPISTWVPGASWAQTKSNPWDDSIARAKRAMQDGTLKGILWHQGESDCNPKDAP